MHAYIHTYIQTQRTSKTNARVCDRKTMLRARHLNLYTVKAAGNAASQTRYSKTTAQCCFKYIDRNFVIHLKTGIVAVRTTRTLRACATPQIKLKSAERANARAGTSTKR